MILSQGNIFVLLQSVSSFRSLLTLQNFLTDVSQKILNYLPDCTKIYKVFHRERFVEKKKKISKVILKFKLPPLTLSWRRPLSYRNQSIYFRRKSMDWSLYDNCLRHERVNWYIHHDRHHLWKSKTEIKRLSEKKCCIPDQNWRYKRKKSWIVKQHALWWWRYGQTREVGNYQRDTESLTWTIYFEWSGWNEDG